MEIGFKRPTKNGSTKNKLSTSKSLSNKSPLCADTSSMQKHGAAIRTYFPIIKSDMERVLPRYTKYLSLEPEDGGVQMDDLMQIQQDLEKLFSTCIIRHRLLKFALEPSSDLKQERLEEKPRPKELKNTKKQKNASPSAAGTSTLTKNVKVNEMPLHFKFLQFVNLYCQEINKDNVCFLQDLINDCSQPIDLKIPELGKHYAQEWSDDNIQSEQHNGALKVVTKRPSSTNAFDVKKNKLNNAISENCFGPLTLRILDTLMEEKVMEIIPSVFGKLRQSDCQTKIEDEILEEIIKCQNELAKVNERNRTQLEKLLTIVKRDLEKQEIKHRLDAVNDKVINIYNRILSVIQKHAEDMVISAGHKWMLPRPNFLEFEEEATEVLNEQLQIQKELAEFPDCFNQEL